MGHLTRSTAAALIGLALLASQANAQQGLRLGVRGGVTVATASADVEETLSTNNRTGFSGGVFLNYDIGILGFQVAGQYTQKGVELDFEDAVSDISLDYLEIPAVIKAGLPLGIIKPSLLGGVAFSFNTKCDDSGDDCGDEVKSTDVLGIAGADVAIYLGSISVWADGRYHFGLSNVNEAEDLVGDLKNRNWTFQAGLAFGL
ncbi:MAG: PorT family protein [Gemmatimonadota bacterium]|nr:MAG: PorT family protein [Gemmatimonadota bacterium]